MGAQKRILFVKANSETSDILWLDRLCNGLLSWSSTKGLLRDGDVFRLICVVPEISEIHQVYLWLEKEDFPWAKVPRSALEGTEAFWSGDFSKGEVTEGRRLFASLQEWRQLELPQFEGGGAV